MKVINVISLCISCFTLGFCFKILLDEILDKIDKRKEAKP